MGSALSCQDAGGSGTTYTCNLSPAPTAYVTGNQYYFKANTANSGAATINFNSLGAVTIKKPFGGSITADLAANDIRANQWVHLLYDGTNMQMTSQVANAFSATSPVTLSTANVVACATCVTSAASLTSTALMTGAGSQASQTPSATATLTSGGAMSLPSTVTTTGLTFTGSAPAVTTSGTTPYLNMNTLVKGTINTCSFAFTTSTFTLALSPLSICSPVWTLPNAALTWVWSCDIAWSVNAGTTPTLSFGENWSQSPSAAIEMGNILTTNTGTSTQMSMVTTTNSTMTASPTLTTSATLFTAYISGKFTGSATSGTFTPTATLVGTSATGTLNGGCTIQ